MPSPRKPIAEIGRDGLIAISVKSARLSLSGSQARDLAAELERLADEAEAINSNFPGEEWRAVSGMEGQYEVSSFGRIRSIDRIVEDKNGRKMRYSGKLIALRKNPRTGYMEFAAGSRGGMRRVHRVVLEAFVGPCPAGMEACHNDGDKTNNRSVNLRWDNKTSNSYDTVRHGMHHYAKRDRCKYGHEFSEFGIESASGRLCLACNRRNRADHKLDTRIGNLLQKYGLVA